MQLVSYSSLVNELKNNEEDFEFYPTTDEILQKIVDSGILERKSSVIDIGCGNGKALDFFKKNYSSLKLFGIEKSQTLTSNLINKDILILGNDFKECMLIDKAVDVTFCNPPYKEFKEWVLKIVNYSISKNIILVIPQRWKNDKDIIKTIEEKTYKYSIIGEFDFYEADRKARAKVDVIHIVNYREEVKFEEELEKSFKLEKLFKEFDKLGKNNEEKDNKQIVSNKDLIDYLLGRYEGEYRNMFKSLENLGGMDASLLKTFKIDKHAIINAVKEHLKGIKNKYWKELINKIPEITKRLNRNQKYDLFYAVSNYGAEFSKPNIINVILYAINQAKDYEKQNFVKFWKRLASEENIRGYKSNKKAFIDNHRYEMTEKYHKGKLDYRIITYGGTYESWRMKGACLANCTFIDDLLPIANALGYFGEEVKYINETFKDKEPVYTNAYSGFQIGDNDVYVGSNFIARVKAFKNGNIHIFFDKEFLAKLNIQVFKLLGWIKNKSEAFEEFKEEVSNSETNIQTIEDILTDKTLKLGFND